MTTMNVKNITLMVVIRAMLILKIKIKINSQPRIEVKGKEEKLEYKGGGMEVENILINQGKAAFFASALNQCLQQ